MPRIVGGALGGRVIEAPSIGTRPTSERVREAVFSKLEHANALAGARVLDLFAGSGALAFEALSRGGERAVIVEQSRKAAEVVRQNAQALGVAARVELVVDDAARFMSRLGREAAVRSGFDLVLLDPPYDYPPNRLDKLLVELAEGGTLADGAVVVVERSTRSTPPQWPLGLYQTDQKKYGETTVYFAVAEPAEPGAPAMSPLPNQIGVDQ